MVGRYDTRRGWDVANGTLQRCSSPSLFPSEWIGPAPYFNQRLQPRKYYWNGISVNIPDEGFESLLTVNQQTFLPTDGTKYIATTRGRWQVSCLGALKNGTGEGFVIRLPNGQRYFFDWIAARNAPDVTACDFPCRDMYGDGNRPEYLLVPTSDIFIYATRVEDRFGNSVSYNYDAANPHRLTSIVASDGPRIDISYGANGKVEVVRAAGQSWLYRYTDSFYGPLLSEIEQPDHSKWTFSGDVMAWLLESDPMPSAFYSEKCLQDATGYRSEDQEVASRTKTVVMQHPSGAIGRFKFRQLIHGSQNTPGGCGMFGTSMTSFYFGAYGIPSASVVNSIVQKSISGPGEVNGSWDYKYAPKWSFQTNCSGGCTSTTRVTEPDGSARLYTFGNDYAGNLGDLLGEQVIDKKGAVVRSTSHAYVAASAEFPATYGDALAPDANPLVSKIRPRRSTTIVQDGTTLTQLVNSFDSLARPVSTTRGSKSP
jgi:hypothetical protein